MKNVPISNFEILKWVKYRGIDNFIKVISRNRIPNLKNNGCFIINLDSSYGQGTHWIAIHIKPNIIEYFDSFGLYPPLEFIELVRKRNMRYVYNSSHYQNMYSTTCGYFCLYYVDQSCRLKKEFYQIVKPLNEIDTISNENFIQKYFENILFII